MEQQKFKNLLDTASNNVPRFTTKNLIEVHDQSDSAEDRYKPNKQIRFKALVLRSDLCDYRNAHIVVKGKNTVIFDPRKVSDNNNFPDELFPNRIFPNGGTAKQTNTARAAAKTAAVNHANNNDTRDFTKGIFLETILHLLIIFERSKTY